MECEDFASSLAEKKAACRGKDTVGTGCLRTIGHLFLGNFRRRLARVLVIFSDHGVLKKGDFFPVFLSKLCQETSKMRIFSDHGVWKKGDFLQFFFQNCSKQLLR